MNYEFLQSMFTIFVQFSSVSHVWLFATLWTAARQTSLYITNSQSLSNSCPSSWWCHPTISSSVISFSSPCYFCYRICQQQKTKQKSKMIFSCLTSNPSITVKNNLFYMNIKVYTELNKIMDFHWISKSSKSFPTKINIKWQT